MNDYYHLRINLKPCSEDATDLLAGLLADEGYESFVPDDEGLSAYIKKELYDEAAVARVIDSFPFECETDVAAELVEGRDWNAEWEQNYFKPIVVGNRVVIHSSFHHDVPQAEFDIVIDPKMAFGTGHHSTTSLIIANLLNLELKGKSMIDMGTGTGILAILASMLGAGPVTAIEIDGFAYENAVENVALNGHPEIKVINGDASALNAVEPADVFVANINRNVITADLPAYAPRLKTGGTMLLSGFYEGDDVDIVSRAAENEGLSATAVTTDNRWACIRLIKTK